MAMSREAFAQVRRNRGLSMKNYIYYFFEERKKGEKMVERKKIHTCDKISENSWKEFEAGSSRATLNVNAMDLIKWWSHWIIITLILF